ncbi:MAG: hypothetical protein J6Z49_03140 [Kiritimatiellae bacterium]|nr:hypothetical protein [Kiritimatiellia bacterium]
MNKTFFPLIPLLFAAAHVGAIDLSGPTEWASIHTNAIHAWQAGQKPSASLKVWNGVVADLSKREVRFLVEASGHRSGVTTEFAVVGPMSDRAYESAAVSVASPGDIVRAVEALGTPRGGCVDGRIFRFWPCGERYAASFRALEGDDKPSPVASLFLDTDKASPMLGEGGIVFTGGEWRDGVCLTDTNMPSSVISLYNEGQTVFDIPFQFGQSEVYGRVTLAKTFKQGDLLEFILRPILSPDGKLRVHHYTVKVSPRADGGVVATLLDTDGTRKNDGSLADTLTALRQCQTSGIDPFVMLDLAESLTVKQAQEIATAFELLDGKGLKMDGRPEGGLFFRAYLPLAKWRERKDRIPQPFEVHLARDADGKTKKTLTFVEEDWSGEELDPKLTPRDYPFEQWEELPSLVKKTGGEENKVNVLFLFAPLDMKLGDVLPAARVLQSRLPVVYLFGD